MSESEHMPPRVTSPQPSRGGVLLALGVILLVALGVRSYGLSGESIWWDEFSSLIHMPAPTAYQASEHFAHWQSMVQQKPADGLIEFLRKNRELDPATMPLYYTLEYVWGVLVGRDPTGMRLLSVLLGVLTVPFMFLLGRSAYGTRAGLVAALCFAMSPIHRHFGQEIRMYVLFILLAAISAYTFTMLVRDGRRKWWIAHGVANLFLFWTHPFAVFLPAVQGLFLLYLYRRNFKQILKWSALQAMVVAPAAVYVSTIRFWSSDQTSNWMQIPSWPHFIGDLLADDAVGMTPQLRPDSSLTFWAAFLPDSVVNQIALLFMMMGYLFALLALLCVGALIYRSLIWKATESDAGVPADKGRAVWSIFFLLWWLLPPLLLITASHLIRPMIMPRYTVHCSLALYIIVGAVIAHLPGRLSRGIAVAGLIALFGYQLSLVMTTYQRTDYRGAAAQIHRESHPGDLILMHNWLWKRVFAYNLGPVPNPVSYGHFSGEYYQQDFRILADQCAFYLSHPDLIRKDANGTGIVWVALLTNYYGVGPCPPFEHEIARRNLNAQLFEYHGVKHLLLYKVTPGDRPPIMFPEELPENAGVEFGDLSIELVRVGYDHLAEAARRKAVALDASYGRDYAFRKGAALFDMGDYDRALAAYEEAIANPAFDNPQAWIDMGIILNEKGRHVEAQKALERAVAMWPEESWAYTNLAYAFLGQRNFDFAIGTFNKAIELDDEDERPRTGLQETYDLREELGMVPE